MLTTRTTILRTAVTAAVLFVLAALGPAPIRGDRYGIKPHTNLQKQDEKTLESEQHPVIMGQVGGAAPVKHEQQMYDQTSSQDAARVFKAAARGDASNGAIDANQVLAAGSARIQPSSSHGWLWAALVLATVVGGVIGVKKWADHTIPDLPAPSPKRQGW